jgi:glycosyltransferase involved in cell wall biosynthesis
VPGPRVLIASYSGVLGGAERVLLDCATRLGRPVTVACPEGPLAAALRAAGLEQTPIPARTLRLGPAHLAGIAGLARDMRRLQPPTIVAWGARAVLATALIRRPPPWLAVHHDLLSPAVRATVRAASRRADGVAAASHAVARDIGGDVAVLHPGVDLDAFTPAPLPDRPPHALVLGALVGWKRPDLALEIAARMPELRLTLAGAPLPGDDGGLEAALRARAAKPDLAGRVTFAGPIADVPGALAEAHVLLHCSDAEPYGLALVEALAAGRPVVAPAAGGPLEIVTDGAGRLYTPGDPEAAARALREVLAGPDAGAAARRRAEAAFDVRASTRRLEEALDAALARRDVVGP